MSPVAFPRKSLYSCQDSMLALCGALPSARRTWATMSRSAMDTTNWGPKWDLKIFPYSWVCFCYSITNKEKQKSSITKENYHKRKLTICHTQSLTSRIWSPAFQSRNSLKCQEKHLSITVKYSLGKQRGHTVQDPWLKRPKALRHRAWVKPNTEKMKGPGALKNTSLQIKQVRKNVCKNEKHGSVYG